MKFCKHCTNKFAGVQVKNGIIYRFGKAQYEFRVKLCKKCRKQFRDSDHAAFRLPEAP